MRSQPKREAEAPTVEMDVGGSGRRVSQPVRIPAEVTARHPVDPEAVAVPCVREPEPVLNIQGPSVTENKL